MEVSVIILTFNSSKYIDELLSSLTDKYKSEIKEEKLEIIVADNDSKDDTVSHAKKHSVKVIENGGNLGYAKGNNLAAQKAKGDVIIFLNPDIKIVSGDIFTLLDEFVDPKVGIVGGRILSFDNNAELSCGRVYNWFNTLLLSIGLEETFGVRFAPSKTENVSFVSGTFLAIRRGLFTKLNGFDEHYFMYIEDADICFRAKKEGYKVVFSPTATIQHVGQGSSNRTFAVVNIYKGLVYFHKKRMGNSSYKIVRLFLSVKAIILVIIGKISHNYYLVSTYEEALKAIG